MDFGRLFHITFNRRFFIRKTAKIIAFSVCLVAAFLILLPTTSKAQLPSTGTSITSPPPPPAPVPVSAPNIRCCPCVHESCINDWACDFCELAGTMAIYGIDLLVYQRMEELRDFMIDRFWWGGGVGSGLGEMSRQFTATGFAQVMAVGSFFDATHQMKTQNVLGKIHADAVRQYQPSTALCRFGSATQSLASSEHRAMVSKQIMAEKSLGRYLARKGTVGANISADIVARVEQFKNVYCDPRHNNGTLVGPASQDPVCGTTGGDPAHYNKDINITDTIFTPTTLNADFTRDGTLPQDAQNILALSKNLYGYDISNRIPSMGLDSNDEGHEEKRKVYHEYRSLLAKRSVAKNSYHTLAALKTQGTPGSAPYLVQFLEELGIPESEAQDLLSAAPSYDAQLEVLTKKIYQSPNFIKSLIDKPENVKRQQAAMMAVELMQRRESYKSMLRQEMIVAVMLELFLDKRFKEVSNKMNELKE